MIQQGVKNPFRIEREAGLEQRPRESEGMESGAQVGGLGAASSTPLRRDGRQRTAAVRELREPSSEDFLPASPPRIIAS